APGAHRAAVANVVEKMVRPRNRTRGHATVGDEFQLKDLDQASTVCEHCVHGLVSDRNTTSFNALPRTARASPGFLSMGMLTTFLIVVGIVALAGVAIGYAV